MFKNVKTGKHQIIDSGFQVNLGLNCEYSPLQETRLMNIAKMEDIDDAFITSWEARGRKYIDIAIICQNRRIAEFKAWKYQHRTMYDLSSGSRIFVN